MVYVFSEDGYKKLQKLIGSTRKKLDEVSKEKSEAHKGQDSWHDEGFKIGIYRELLWSKRLSELQGISNQARVILNSEIINQNEFVNFGVGVVIEYENGKEEKFIISGYQLCQQKDPRNVRHIYVYSPLGKAIFKACVGEERVYEVGDKKFRVKITKIVAHSSLDKF